MLSLLLRLILALAVIDRISISSRPPGVAQTIADAKWKQRVVLVTAPTPSSRQPDFLTQKQLLVAAEASLRERDVLVLYRLHGEMSPSEKTYLGQHYGLRLKGFEVLLIGKDGGVKLRRTQPVAPQELFGLIDQMPMRRQEMRQRR